MQRTIDCVEMLTYSVNEDCCKAMWYCHCTNKKEVLGISAYVDDLLKRWKDNFYARQLQLWKESHCHVKRGSEPSAHTAEIKKEKKINSWWTAFSNVAPGCLFLSSFLFVKLPKPLFCCNILQMCTCTSRTKWKRFTCCWIAPIGKPHLGFPVFLRQSCSRYVFWCHLLTFTAP